MPHPSFITVTGAPARSTPIHPNDGREPGGGVLYADDASLVRVRWSQDVRRSVTRGDLFPCDMNGAPVTVTLAAAPNELPGGRIKIDRTKKGPTP